MDTSSLDTSQIKDWRSIVTLVVFVLTNIVVLFPFTLPIYIPRRLWNGWLRSLVFFRIIPPKAEDADSNDDSESERLKESKRPYVVLKFPMGFVTAPLIADLFLLAILAIGRQEVHDGTIGADNIQPIDIMAFFLTLAYIAISLDASGLIRWLAFKVLQKAGKNGRRLYFYLYTFFFALASFVGNDPIVLSGTAFLAYMTRVSSNIRIPRAWIFTQFAVANIGSCILVSSNPTNLVLAGAFGIKFIHYTANVIVPVIVTAIVLFPFLLYVIFTEDGLVPCKIKLHELPEERRKRKPVNPNIPPVRGNIEENHMSKEQQDEQEKLLSLEEIMNPFLDRGGAAFGAVVMTATLVTILALNAASQSGHEHPIFWITLPAAFVMFCWDVGFGWAYRKETRRIATEGREKLGQVSTDQAMSEGLRQEVSDPEKGGVDTAHGPALTLVESPDVLPPTSQRGIVGEKNTSHRHDEVGRAESRSSHPNSPVSPLETAVNEKLHAAQRPKPSLQSLLVDGHRWLQETFPTVTAVFAHLPFPLVPFGLCMFVLVQGLVTKGWVPVFAHGWDHWVNKTGVVGAIGGMGFLSVILCNFAGTNIGTTILLSRIIQAWLQIHRNNDTAISQRMFWATVYSMAIGVNFGAFSTAFSASLAGLLWRDILSRKHITVKSLEFARVNLPIIAITMVVSLTVLVGEVYLTRDEKPYVGG